MAFLLYCKNCKKITRHNNKECLKCKEIEQVKFDQQWYNKTLEDKVNWLYNKIKKG
ncbi:MAG: hypothetical protein ACOCRX_07190 [Candidatus Woesearchaeota archaeon]